MEDQARKDMECLVGDLEKAGVRALIRTRKYHLRSYESCFTGKDLVRFFIKHGMATNPLAGWYIVRFSVFIYIYIYIYMCVCVSLS
jgi:hypothetical protein